MFAKKFKLLFSSLPAILAIPFCVACNQNTESQNTLIDSKVMDEQVLQTLNNKQIVTLNDYYPFLKNTSNKLLENVEFKNGSIFANSKYINAGNKGLFWKKITQNQPITNDKGIEIATKKMIDVVKDKKAPKIDINDFFKQYNFNDIFATNSYSSWITATLPLIYKVNYSPINLKTFPDIQSIVYKLIDDMTNGTWASVETRKFFDGYFYNFKNIRAKVWLQKPEQQKMFETLLLTYINTFNTEVKSIKVIFDKNNIIESKNGDFVSFSLSCFDKNNRNLVNKQNQKMKFWLFGFRNYKYNPKFGVGEEIKQKKLFNEYLVNPVLRFKLNNDYSVIDINSFVSGAYNPEFTSADGLKYFLNHHKDIIEIDVPEYRKKTDRLYQFIEAKMSPYFGTRQVLVAKIRVIHNDGSTEDFDWLSSDFDDHGHKMKPLIKSIKNQLLFNQIDKKLPLVNISKDMYSLVYGQNLKPNFDGIDANDFYNSDLFKHILETIDLLPIKHIKMAYDLKLWNNDVKYNYEAGWVKQNSPCFQYLETWLNLFVLQYAINTKVGDINTMLDHVKIEILDTPYQPGRVALKFHFIAIINGKEVELLNKDNQNKIVYWNGFKGYNHSLDVPFSFQ